MDTTQHEWDDTRINARINDILTKYHHTPRGLARRVAYEVRDHLTARLAAAEAERDLFENQAGVLEDNGRLVAWRMVNAEERVKELEQELAALRANGHNPMRDTVGGVINAEWDTPEENAAWAHLSEGEVSDE